MEAHYVVIEGEQREAIENCILHGLFDSLDQALHFGNTHLHHAEWHVATLKDVLKSNPQNCEYAGWKP